MTDLHPLHPPSQRDADDAPWEPVEGREVDDETPQARQLRLDVEGVLLRLDGAQGRDEVLRVCDELGFRHIFPEVFAAVQEKRERDRQRRRARRPFEVSLDGVEVETVEAVAAKDAARLFLRRSPDAPGALSVLVGVREPEGAWQRFAGSRSRRTNQWTAARVYDTPGDWTPGAPRQGPP